MLAKRLMMVRDEPTYSETYQKIVEFSNFLKQEGISVNSKNQMSVKADLLVSIAKICLFGALVFY